MRISFSRRHSRINVLVLSAEQWPDLTSYPVYGMPHYTDPHTLIVAGENNDLWRGMVPPLNILSLPMSEALRNAYGRPDGPVDVSPFFDLLVVHELAHLFHEQANIQFPRLWLKEFFSNLSLHAYVANESPAELAILETLPRVVVEADGGALAHHTLADFERLYTDMDARNYGWYQCQLHVEAKKVYDAGGLTTLRRLWHAFTQPAHDVSDAQLAEYLRTEAHPCVAQIMANWPSQQTPL